MSVNSSNYNYRRLIINSPIIGPTLDTPTHWFKFDVETTTTEKVFQNTVNSSNEYTMAFNFVKSSIDPKNSASCRDLIPNSFLSQTEFGEHDNGIYKSKTNRGLLRAAIAPDSFNNTIFVVCEFKSNPGTFHNIINMNNNTGGAYIGLATRVISSDLYVFGGFLSNTSAVHKATEVSLNEKYLLTFIQDGGDNILRVNGNNITGTQSGAFASGSGVFVLGEQSEDTINIMEFVFYRSKNMSLTDVEKWENYLIEKWDI